MSDVSETPRRQIGGLSSLARMHGDTTADPRPAAAPARGQTAATPAAPPQDASPAPERPAAAVSAPLTAQKASTRPKSRTRAPKAASRPIPAADGSPTEKMTTYIDQQTRARAKAAFKATAHLEGDVSFSEFIESAIARELQRRETLYNDGQPYAGDGGRLSAGRPLS